MTFIALKQVILHVVLELRQHTSIARPKLNALSGHLANWFLLYVATVASYSAAFLHHKVTSMDVNRISGSFQRLLPLPSQIQQCVLDTSGVNLEHPAWTR